VAAEAGRIENAVRKYAEGSVAMNKFLGIVVLKSTSVRKIRLT
jgi:hypothetical protein